jgi:hypothetical protein
MILRVYLWPACLLAMILCLCPARADQPVMNEVPRWNGGYGGQIFQEFRWSDDLMRGSADLSNPDKLRYEENITSFEGVYTWHKSIRVTAKVPYVNKRRIAVNKDGSTQWQKSSGLDDTKLAVPIRKYRNRRHYSGHMGIVPQVRFGGNSDDAYRISDGSVDYAMGVSFESESAGFKISMGGTYWWEQESGQDDDWSTSLELGYNYHDRGAAAWRMDYVDDGNKYAWLAGGPVLFWNFNDVVLGRIEYKFPFYEKVDDSGLARGQVIRLGLGAVF